MNDSQTKPLRCLVTGGAGFIGSNLVKRLLAQGHAVQVLDNLSTGNEHNLSGCHFAELQIGDVASEHAVLRAVSGIDTIFHLAASVGNTRSLIDPIHDAETNVRGTINVLEAARRYGIRKVVFSSSAGVYGQMKTLPITEGHPCEPDSPYGCSKLCAEKLCLAYARLYGLSVACLRYFNVYGPNQRYDAYGNVIPIFAQQLLRGEVPSIFGNGEQTRDFVSVHDVARANLLAATTDCPSRAYNIGSGEGVTINELVKIMQAKHWRYVPARRGDVLHSVADISEARMAFGYKPLVSLEEGLAEYMAWAKKDSV